VTRKISWRPAGRALTLTLALWLPLLGGCATLFTGTTDVLRFEANVPGVRLSIDGQYRGELPLTLEMSRNFVGGKLFQARFEKAGYATQEFKLNREFNTVAILDITSPVTSGGIDVLTGALLRFSPLDYHLLMLADGQSPGSTTFRRSVELHGFALAHHRQLQKDLARGGGPHLTTLAALIGGGDETAARRVAEASLRAGPALLEAPSAAAFVARLDALLAGDPGLRPFRL